jgi:quercetin 2,3-dioxygenase
VKGHKAPVISLSPAFIYDVKIPQGQSVELPIAGGDTYGIYLVDGELEIGEIKFLPGTMVKLDTENEIVSIKALNHSRLIVLGGTPLDESIVFNCNEYQRRNPASDTRL